MDQVKEYLQIAIKYRFWIIVSVAGLLFTIAWFATQGAMAEAEAQKVTEIKSAVDAVKKFANNSTPVVPIYKKLVTEKTEVLTKDVNASWRKLYDRQAPLLKWPEEVADTIPVWKRAWPEETDPRRVTREINKYVVTYKPFVDEVYQSFKPFDYDTGEGIVVAPSKDALLRHPIFAETDVPTLGKVWDTQQRLWVQRTVLDVVAKVNEKFGATNWMTAPIKQILALEVASQQAQDQKSFAKGEVLKESPDVLSPEEQAALDLEASDSEGTGAADLSKMMRGGGGTAAMMGSLGGGGGGADAGPRPPEPFLILESPNQDQAFVVPIHLSVYVQQERIPDLLVEFQNSPMNIEVLDFSYYKPEPHSVERPEKGKPPAGYNTALGGGMGGGGGGAMDMRTMMSGGGMSSSRGYGNMGYGADMMNRMRGGGGNMSYDPSGGANYSRMGRGGGTGSMYGGGSGGTATQKKERESIDKRQEVIERLDREASKKDDKDKSASEDEPTPEEPKAADPYYDVVRVDIYGRARFYMPPPPEPEVPQSEADLGDAETPATDADASAEAPAEAGADLEAAPDADAMPADAETPRAEADADAEAPKAEADADAPKAEADTTKPEGEGDSPDGTSAPAGEAEPRV